MQIPPYLVNEHYDDRYFDVVNAIEEAKHIFFQGSGLMEIFSAMGPGRKEFRIGETGFRRRPCTYCPPGFSGQLRRHGYSDNLQFR